VVPNVVARPWEGRRLVGGANRQRFSVLMVCSAPRCGGVTPEDDGRWGEYCRLAEPSQMQPFYTSTMEEASSSVVGRSRGGRGLGLQFPAVEVSGKNCNRMKIGYSYNVYGRTRGREVAAN
jgi:hypothetical protein